MPRFQEHKSSSVASRSSSKDDQKQSLRMDRDYLEWEANRTEAEACPDTRKFPVPTLSDLPEHAGVARARVAVTKEHPLPDHPMPKGQTVLQQHCEFFDLNGDGIITVQETWKAFRKMGFSWFISLGGVLLVHGFLSYLTQDSWLPDPYFRILLKNAHRGKHGSDTGVYDREGRFVPMAFESIFTRYDTGHKGGLTLRECLRMAHHNRLAGDFVGGMGAFLEWSFTWWMAADRRTGLLTREAVRGVHDGSLFYTIAKQNEERHKERAPRQYGWISTLWDLRWCLQQLKR